MSAPNQQDTTDPSSLLYYAPRRLRDRASALRTTQLDSRQGIEPLSAPDVEALDAPDLEPLVAPDLDPQAYDGPSEPSPEIARHLEPDTMEALLLLSQRARKRQVFAPAIRFAGVASLAAVVAFTYVMLTELPDQNAVNEVAGPIPKIVTEVGDANINEPALLDIKATSSNSVPATEPETTGARESSSPVTPEQDAVPFPQFQPWQGTLAQAQQKEKSVERAVPATRDPQPRRKRKSRKHQVDDAE
jgi:hypothetical protein